MGEGLEQPCTHGTRSQVEEVDEGDGGSQSATWQVAGPRCPGPAYSGPVTLRAQPPPPQAGSLTPHSEPAHLALRLRPPPTPTCPSVREPCCSLTCPLCLWGCQSRDPLIGLERFPAPDRAPRRRGWRSRAQGFWPMVGTLPGADSTWCTASVLWPLVLTSAQGSW